MRDEFTLADLLKNLWRARFWMMATAAVFGLIGALVIVFSTPVYRANMIIAPADGYALGDYASSVSEGEAVHLPFWRPRDQEGVSTDFYRFIYTAKGRSAASILLQDSSVLQGITKDTQWPHEGERWSAEELADYLEKKVKVEHLGTTPLRRLSYSHPDPAFAATFLRKIHLVADQMIRRDRRRQSESRIAYLKDTLQKTANPDHRRGIVNLLMQQEHIQMLANLNEAYAAIIVEPPSSSPKPVWPDKVLIMAASLLIGLGLGYVIHGWQHAKG